MATTGVIPTNIGDPDEWSSIKVPKDLIDTYDKIVEKEGIEGLIEHVKKIISPVSSDGRAPPL